MTKCELYTCYMTYFEKYPEKRWLKNVNFDGIESISKYYLNQKQVSFWNNLLDELSITQIVELNTKYQDMLQWEWLESSLTTQDLDEFECQNGVKLPKEFRVFLMGYTPLLGTILADFVGSEDYYCYTFNPETGLYDDLYEDGDDDTPKIAKVEFSFTPVLYKRELSYFQNTYPMLLSHGLLCLGTLYCVGQEILFLDCCTGEVVSMDHDVSIPNDCSKDQLRNLMHFRFKNFDHFLKCMLGVEIYDAQKEDEKRVEAYREKPNCSSSSTNVIAL